MGTNTPHTCIPGLIWQKQARRFSQFELKVGKLRFPIHFVCVSAALYHRGVRGRHFPLRWIWPIFAAAFEKRSLPPYTRVRWRGMVRCGAFATKARKSMVVETSFAEPTTDDEARLDIKAAGFWGDGCEEAFFDVRVFNPFAASYRTLSVPALYRRHEREKRARYEERVREVERAAFEFTPLVFSAAGGASKLTTTFLKQLASLLAERLNEPYCVAMAWLRARLSFSLLRSAIACFRSSRRKFHIDSQELHPALAVGQAGLPTWTIVSFLKKKKKKKSFAALVRECTDCVRRASLRARRCC